MQSSLGPRLKRCFLEQAYSPWRIVMKSLKYLPILALTFSGCANSTTNTSDAQAAPAAPAPVITIYRHAAWETMPAKGVAADGIRRNLGPEDSVEFKDLTVTMKEMKAAESAD